MSVNGVMRVNVHAPQNELKHYFWVVATKAHLTFEGQENTAYVFFRLTRMIMPEFLFHERSNGIIRVEIR